MNKTNNLSVLTAVFMNMNKILALTVLLLPACASAQAGVKEAAMAYTENGYFTVKIPAGWNKAEVAFGLSQEEKKVYGAEFFGPKDADGISSRISVRYYAPGNMLHKTAEKFIATHSRGEKYGPVKNGLVGKYYAKVFERRTFKFVPPEVISPKKVSVYEKFHVIPVKNGFYVLSYYSSMAAAKTGLAEYESVLASLELDLGYVDAYYNRGLAYDNKGLYDEAIKDYTKVIELNPLDVDAYYYRGLAYKKKGLYDEAIKDYTKVIELDPSDAADYNNRGVAYDNKGLYDEAIKDYTKTIELDLGYVDAYYNRGLAYDNKGLYDEAIKDYTKAIELNPKDADAYNNRGVVYYLKGEKELSISDLKKSADLGLDLAKNNLKKYFDIDY